MQASHQLEIAVPTTEVWRALTDPEIIRRWYHGAVVEAEWRPGGAISFRLPDGSVAESGVVVEIQKPSRLVLDTRLTWDETVRGEPEHRTTWELEPTKDGTLVKLRFDVPDAAVVVSHMLREDGGYVLKGMRLILDVGEQARLARRDVIGPVEIRDLTSDRVADYHHFFDAVGFQDHPEWQSCYCHETNLEPDPFRTVAARRQGMADLIGSGEVTALLAYADGGPVAWCNYGETTRLAGVMAKLGLAAADHEKVGSVACFVIASQYRRHGIARRLLDEACARLKARGCLQVEAYPPKDSSSDYGNYRGPLAMYLEAGFQPYREAGRSLIVRKAL